MTREDDGNEGAPVRRDPPSAPETANRKVWAHVDAVARFASAQGWIDRSERVLLERTTTDHVGGDVLDIGVGGGRTVPLLRPAATRYVGIDFLPELVTASSNRFPDADIRVGDARHLDFPDASFDLVVFSINGIDAISHSDRSIAMREIHRVLRPSGTFVFSTHNRDGPGPRERPWTMPPVSVRQPRSSARTLVHRMVRFRTSMTNYRQSVSINEVGPDWMVTSSGAHDFGLVVHYTTASAVQAELRASGFAGAIELWDDRAGLPADQARPQRKWWYFNVLARCSAVDGYI
ncbi:MAG: class I SAM-dependent methyltransferase [Ilumatobacteraceae bacterium]